MAQETLQTVERALTVLRTFSRDSPEVRPSELARTLNLPRTIVTRLLNTLEQAGFVERETGDSRYRIGLAAFEVGAVYLANNPLITVAVETLEQLTESTGCTSYLGVLDGHDAVLVSVREGRRPIRFVFSAGDRFPASTTALGKAMLMGMTPEQINQHVGSDRLTELTEHSVKTRAELDAQLADGRGRGWIAAQDESHPGGAAVGAAIFDASETPIAGLSVSFVNYPPDPSVFEQLGAVVRDAAQQLTQRVATYRVYGQRTRLQIPSYRDPAAERTTGNRRT